MTPEEQRARWREQKARRTNRIAIVALRRRVEREISELARLFPDVGRAA